MTLAEDSYAISYLDLHRRISFPRVISKVFISRLRAKLRRPGGPEYMETERGRGYRFARPREFAATA
jgi:DNA-binding response OmpR family regulator